MGDDETKVFVSDEYKLLMEREDAQDRENELLDRIDQLIKKVQDLDRELADMYKRVEQLELANKKLRPPEMFEGAYPPSIDDGTAW